MTNIQKAIPVLLATDVMASATFYKQLGFQWLYGDQNYAALALEDVEIHLSPMHGLTIKEQYLLGGWTSFRVQVSDLQALMDAWILAKCIDPKDNPLVKKEYGMLELTILDPSGSDFFSRALGALLRKGNNTALYYPCVFH